jgi:hypothetical protein
MHLRARNGLLTEKNARKSLRVVRNAITVAKNAHSGLRIKIPAPAENKTTITPP